MSSPETCSVSESSTEGSKRKWAWPSGTDGSELWRRVPEIVALRVTGLALPSGMSFRVKEPVKAGVVASAPVEALHATRMGPI